MNDVRDDSSHREKDEFKLLLLQVVIFLFFYTLEKCYLTPQTIIQMTEEKTDIATLAWGCLYSVSTV